MARRRPEDVGLDSAVLRAAGERLTAFTEANLPSLLVVRRGALVYERYFVGEDEAWADRVGRVSFDASTKHDVRSITKSVTALLVGKTPPVSAIFPILPFTCPL